MRSSFLIALLAFTLIFSSSFHFDKNQNVPDDKKSRIEVFFNSSTGFTELVMIKAHLETKGIVIDYKKIEYNKKVEFV